MLVIRKEQMDAFGWQTEEEFVRFVMEHIREESPERVLGYADEYFEEMVRNGLARARSHGFREEEDLAAFVAIMFEIAPNFDEQPNIKKVLDDKTIPSDRRFEQLWGLTSNEDWEEAKRNSREEAWFPSKEEAKR